jgi:hypothetical protein
VPYIISYASNLAFLRPILITDGMVIVVGTRISHVIDLNLRLEISKYLAMAFLACVHNRTVVLALFEWLEFCKPRI